MDFPDPLASRAVLIGASEYECDYLPQLLPVAENVAKLRELLTHEDLWGLPGEHCVALLDPTDVPAVLDAVHSAASEATDALLVYFAGHGLLHESPGFDLHLALSNTSPERLYTAVPYERIRHEVRHVCDAARRLVILDCCYAGTANDAEGLLGMPDDLASRARIEGTYLMTAVEGTKLALAPRNEQYTAFTGELIKALDHGIADGPDLLDTETLFRHVRSELIAKGRPRPKQRADNFGHRIVLARNRWSAPTSPEADAYATALRHAFQPAADSGVTPDHLGKVLQLPAIQIDRAFQGGWIAPREFVEIFARFLATLGTPLTADRLSRLHALRRTAEKSSYNMETQLRYWQEEATDLKSKLDHASADRDPHHSPHPKPSATPPPTAPTPSPPPPTAPTPPAAQPASVSTSPSSLTPPPTSAPTPSPTPAASISFVEPKHHRPRRPGGRSAIVLAALLVLYLVAASLAGSIEVPLKPYGGRKPAVSPNDRSGQWGTSQYIWDVKGEIESVFRPEDGIVADEILGELTFRIGADCARKSTTITWSVEADGDTVGAGAVTLGGEDPLGRRSEGRLKERKVGTRFALESSPHEVTVSAKSAGGSCGTFGLVWDAPRLGAAFSPVFLFDL